MHEIEALADTLLGVPQRPPHRDLRQGRALDARDRAADDRPRHRGAVSAEAAAPRAGAGARGREPRLGGPARRHLARRRRRRDRRPRRPRRPGPEGAAAGPVRRAARRRPAASRSTAARCAPARRRRPSRRAIGIALVPEDRKTEGPDAADVDRRQSRSHRLDASSRAGLSSIAAEQRRGRRGDRASCRSRSAPRAMRCRRCRAATSRRW